MDPTSTTDTPESSPPPSPPPGSRGKLWQTAAVGLVAGLIGGGIVLGAHDASSSSSSSTSTVTTPATSTTIITGSGPNWVNVAATAMPGVVEISAIQTTTDQLGNPSQTAALGTGFVIDTKGDILTNQHVVGGSSSINVQFNFPESIHEDL